MSERPFRLPYIAWREGRPRFVPGPRERALGFYGQDLRHEDGRWFSFDEAYAFSFDAAAEIRATRAGKQMAPRPPKPKAAPTTQPKKPGGRPRKKHTFVYFLRCGDWVKIGFSTDPTRRVREITTKVPYEITTLLTVPGTMQDEKRLHRALERFRINGEWFAYRSEIAALMARCMAFGKVMFELDEKQKASKFKTPPGVSLPHVPEMFSPQS